MIARDFEIIDIDPSGYANFSTVFPRLNTVSPQLVLWHEEGIPRRLLLDNEVQPAGISRVDDARQTARWLYDSYAGKVRRIVVTDLEGYDRLYAAQNLWPEPEEDKYHFLDRRRRVMIETFDQRLAIFPEPSLDRGPVSFEKIRSFVSRELPCPGCIIFAVFEEEALFFSFIARFRSQEADLITSFEHWPESLSRTGLKSEDLDRAVEVIAREYGPVACALFLARKDFDRLYDGTLHEGLPGSLVLASRAFGYSILPGVPERAFLNTAGFFAYAPVEIP